MKKRQMKKNATKLDRELSKFETQLEVLKKIGIFDLRSDMHLEKIHCHFPIEKFIKLPFLNQGEMIIETDRDFDFPYRITFEKGRFVFFCLARKRDFIKYFPKYNEKTEDYIEVDGVRYMKEVQTNE